jgi:hypothetical protein
MKKIWSWVKDNPNRSMFLLPIILVAGISISHVVSWYDIANPINWAIYLSIAIEVGAMTALVAATNKIRGGVWFMFGLITMIQMIGNIFYSFKEIDPNGELFKSWVELTGPLWESMGSDPTDVISMKRWLAFLEGGLLPIISLTSLHFFVKYEKNNSPKEEEVSPKEKVFDTDIQEIEEIDSPKEEEVSPKEEVIEEAQEDYNSRLQRDAQIVFETIKQIKEEKNEQESVVEEPVVEEKIVEEPVVEEPTIENIVEPEVIKPEKTLGDELKRTWKRIVRNNNISKI